MKCTFPPARSFTNAVISGCRSAWYDLTEPRRVRTERAEHYHELDGIQPARQIVSVIIPTYNRKELLLDRALPSVLSQSHQNFEILVCSHQSDDGTNEAVWKLAAHDVRIRLLVVPRVPSYPPTAENHWLAGPVAPIAAGLQKAAGDWIARLDDDDEWSRDHLSLLLRFAKDAKHEFVSSQYRAMLYSRENPRVVGYRVVDGEGTPKVGGVQTWLYRSYLRFMHPNPQCWRKTWNRVNDLDLAERFRRAGVWMGHLNVVTATVRPRPGETEVGSMAYRENAREVERRLAFR